MNTTPSDEVVLKQDVLGRVKTPKARREQLLDEFERSGFPTKHVVTCARLIPVEQRELTFQHSAAFVSCSAGDGGSGPAMKGDPMGGDENP
jgi:hypothetical protein